MGKASFWRGICYFPRTTRKMHKVKVLFPKKHQRMSLRRYWKKWRYQEEWKVKYNRRIQRGNCAKISCHLKHTFGTECVHTKKGYTCGIFTFLTTTHFHTSKVDIESDFKTLMLHITMKNWFLGTTFTQLPLPNFIHVESTSFYRPLWLMQESTVFETTIRFHSTLRVLHVTSQLFPTRTSKLLTIPINTNNVIIIKL